jgi:hypothetical protein
MGADAHLRAYHGYHRRIVTKEISKIFKLAFYYNNLQLALSVVLVQSSLAIQKS